MRIISGWAGGRRLVAPPGSGTRPTSERVREALFSILGPPPPGARVLDLFAGAGALGLEALSRGAVAAVFVERSGVAQRALRRNIAALGVDTATEVHKGDALSIARRLAARGERFTWIFVDPPYRSDLATSCVELVGATELLAPGGTVIVEHDRRARPDLRSGSLLRTDCRRYGDTEVSFYRRESE